MDILILGGTVFLGRHLVETAQGQGHRLTLFNRGRSNPGLFPNVEQIHGDRAADLDRLSNRHWDAVIDTSGYLPAQVRASAGALARRTGLYVFVSTISVYADFTQPHMDENASLARLDNPEDTALDPETYGALKTHCEDAVLAALSDRGLIIRPGLIVGPHDPTDRFTYWPVRVAQGGELLAPESPGVPIQFIDVRDLAAWILACVAQGTTGVYNTTGPAAPYTLGELLAVCRQTAAADATPVWVSADFLAEHNVAPFADMPLWVPDTLRGISTVDCRRALAAGLSFRPVQATVAETLQWRHSLPGNPPLRAGLTPEREANLLATWYRRYPR
ncbi:MAG: epimerase [Caldilineaceae bacterium]|nr:epimerase [Caldilineaceae bacterium]